MSWVRRVLAYFGHAPLPREDLRARAELESTRPKHRATIKKADRVIEEYAKLDAALLLYVRRK